MKHSIFALAGMLLSACHVDTGYLERKFACTDDPDCVDGQVCHPGLNICVLETEVVDEDIPNDRMPVMVNNQIQFLIDRTEVRVRAYTQCVLRGPCNYPTCTSNDLDSPIHCVSWSDAAAYCQWANGRLPTGAEWVLAAVGEDGRQFPWGDQPASCDYAVLDDGGPGCGTNRPMKVGSKPEGRSPFGALDMIGNVWEWVADERPDGLRTTKGGSFIDAGSLEVIKPNSPNVIIQEPSFTDPSVGFRCAG